MSGRRVRHPAGAETLISLTAKTSSGRHFKIGALATLLAVAAVPVLFRADMPSVAANSTLKCYDSAGNFEPCGTEGNAPRSQLTGRKSVRISRQVGQQSHSINKQFRRPWRLIKQQCGQ